MSDGSFEKNWRDRFVNFAQSNDDDAGIAGWTPAGLEARIRRFLQVWPGDQPGAVWLDAGCGAGTYTRLLASHKLRAIGIDYSTASVQKARDRSPEVSAWGIADVSRLPFRPNCADGVVCLGVTQALASSEKVIAELFAAAKPGGYVWIDGLNSWCLPHLWERLQRKIQGKAPHVRYESPWRLRRGVRQCGAVEIRLYWLPIAPRRFRGAQRMLESRWMQWMLTAIPPLGALLSHSMLVVGRKSSK